MIQASLGGHLLGLKNSAIAPEIEGVKGTGRCGRVVIWNEQFLTVKRLGRLEHLGQHSLSPSSPGRTEVSVARV